MARARRVGVTWEQVPDPNAPLEATVTYHEEPGRARTGYPANDVARTVAELAGTDTISEHTMALAEKLGVTWTDVSLTAFEEFLLSG